MKVLFVVPGYPSSESPTRFVFLKEQVKILVNAKDIDIDVFYVDMLPTRKILSTYNKLPHVEYDGFSAIYSCKMKTFIEKKFPYLTSIRYYKKICRLFDYYVKTQSMPDLIYAHFTFYAGWAATKLGKILNIPVVVLEHGGYLLSKKIKYRKLQMLKYTLDNSDSFYCVSTNLAKAVREHAKCTFTPQVIPNVIGKQFKYFAPNRIQDKFIFLSVGNLYPGKRFDLLIEAFCEAFSFDDSVELRIVGSGECLHDIENIIKKNNRMGQIELLGSLVQSDLIEQYKHCNCFVLPSNHETFGVVYREAMAIGRPVITTNHGGWGGGRI